MKFYKDLFIWYWVLEVAGSIFLLIVVGLGVMPESIVFLIWLVCMLIWVVFCAFLFQLLAGKRLNKLARIRAEECRIEDFKNAWEEFRNQKHSFLFQQGRDNHEQAIKINLSAAYLDLGEAEKGLELLLSVPEKFMNNASGVSYKITYYNNLAATYLQLHDVEHTEQMLAQVREVLEHPKLLKSTREALEKAYQTKKVLVAMQQGNYEGAEAFFLEYLEQETPKLIQVYNHYYLAEVYRHLGNKEREQECLTFVADNGGDSIYAQEAVKRLELLKLQ